MCTGNGTIKFLGGGKLLPQVVVEFAGLGYDMTDLAGFPSTVGGAVRGNAGMRDGIGKSPAGMKPHDRPQEVHSPRAYS